MSLRVLAGMVAAVVFVLMVASFGATVIGPRVLELERAQKARFEQNDRAARP